jgi:hypothetical protein
MAIEILKFDKSLSLVDSGTILVSEGLTIDHYDDIIKTGEGEIEFIISSTNFQIPTLDPIEYSVIIREKVDMTAQGPNEKIITERERKNRESLQTPVDLPPGFIQLKGR